MVQENFGIKVKELRRTQFISQIELADKSGIERAQISKIELGKTNVTLETIRRLSEALGVSVSTLVYQVESPILHPFVKWAGGKTQLISTIKKYSPKEYNCYFEPFVGGGAVLFALSPKNAVINDINKELICAYKCFQDDNNYNHFVNLLQQYEQLHSEQFFYQTREMDRELSFVDLPTYVHATRMVYLNKACFNGLYRVNSKGYFNVPSGKKEKVICYDEKNFKNIKEYFWNNNVNISCEDFEKAIESACENDFVYLDPPYDCWEGKDSFTSYTKDNFNKDSQIRLKEVFQRLTKKNVYVMLSNHNTEFIRELYKEYNIHIVQAKRIINSNSNGRGVVEEVIITNYKD